MSSFLKKLFLMLLCENLVILHQLCTLKGFYNGFTFYIVNAFWLSLQNNYHLNFKQVLPKQIKIIEKMNDFFQNREKNENWDCNMNFRVLREGSKSFLDHSSGIVDPFYGNQYIFFIHTNCFYMRKEVI